MEEEVPILPLLLAGLVLGCFGLEVSRQRSKLRSIFNVFDKQDSPVAKTLEMMVESGQLQPYVPGQTA